MMAKFCVIKETNNLLVPCTNCPCHETFYPYFHGNDQCKVLMKEITKKCTCQTKLTELLGMRDFHNNKPAGNYHEDDWIKRLHQCLLFNDYDSELTAPLRGPQTEESWKSRIPDDVEGNCILFQGAPDLIIKKEHTNEGVINMDPQEEVVQPEYEPVQLQDVDNEAGSSPCSESSDVSGRFQMGHQMTFIPYKRTSYLSEKVGQLIAALHTAVTCRALRKYAMKNKVCSLKAHGLHIHRSLGITHIELTLSENLFKSTQNS